MHETGREIMGEAATVSENMQRFGGSFVSHLGRALAHADAVNVTRVRAAFPDYWDEYLNFGRREEERPSATGGKPA